MVQLCPLTFLRLRSFHPPGLPLRSSSLREEGDYSALRCLLPPLCKATEWLWGSSRLRLLSCHHPLTLPCLLWAKRMVCFSWAEREGWGVWVTVKTGSTRIHLLSFFPVRCTADLRLQTEPSETQHFCSCIWQTLVGKGQAFKMPSCHS